MARYMYMRFPGGKSRALTLSYDDCVESDIRLMAIMDRYGLKGTFNLNGGLYSREDKVWPEGTIHRRMKKSEATAVFAECGYEVAIHGYEHQSLAEIATVNATTDVLRDRLALEEQFGRVIRGMAYANGSYNDAVVQILRDCGIAYARTTLATRDFKIPTDWLRLPATCHHNEPNLMALAERFITEEKRQPRLFYLWGHSYEFDRDDNWNVIEAFASYMGNREDVWYATNIEIYDYVEAYRALQFSANGDRVYNPTAKTVCFAVRESPDTTLVTVAPGESISF